MGRIVAIDFGEKRTGIAITDEMQLIASGLTTVKTTSLLAFLEEYTQREAVVLFVVGLPRQMDHTASESEKRIAPFLKKLKAVFPEIPIKRVDERFTSKMAFQAMLASGLKKKKRRDKSLIDEISATIILQSYLYHR